MPKLIRDKIPELMQKEGESPKHHIADNNEYEHHLKQKLLEEASEFVQNPSKEEFIDVLEVLDAIKSHHGFSDEELKQIKEGKAEKKGKFNNRFILD